MKYEDALAQATEYRNLLVTKLQEQGFVLTATGNLSFRVCQSVEPAAHTSIYLSAEVGVKKTGGYHTETPKVVCDFRLPHRRASTWWGDVKDGWSDQTAVKHAKQIAEMVGGALAEQKQEQQVYENRQASVKLAAQVERNLGESFSRIQVVESSSEGKVKLCLADNYLVSPATAEALARDLAAVLTKYHLPT
jgi:hypothetical protein